MELHHTAPKTLQIWPFRFLKTIYFDSFIRGTPNIKQLHHKNLAPSPTLDYQRHHISNFLELWRTFNTTSPIIPRSDDIAAPLNNRCTCTPIFFILAETGKIPAPIGRMFVLSDQRTGASQLPFFNELRLNSVVGVLLN